jgi:hypothetical protein
VLEQLLRREHRTPDPELPDGSPGCQWSFLPEDTHNTLWYQFVADATSISIETCVETVALDTIIALYDGSCGDLLELDCGEDDCGISTYLSSICYSGLVPGNTYLLMVGNPGSWAGSAPGEIHVDMVCPCPDALACPADVTGPIVNVPDGNVDALDLLLMIAQWGSPCGGDCQADITGPVALVPDGVVDALDLLLLIAQWGSPANCP